MICTTAGTGPDRQTINYSTERVVGSGSFGVVFQATCLETGETVRTGPLLDTAAVQMSDHGPCLGFWNTVWAASASGLLPGDLFGSWQMVGRFLLRKNAVEEG